MHAELMDCERTLLDEVASPEAKRLDIAKTYCLALRSSERGRVDWAKVNAAIVARWSLSALMWIKERAWSGKCFKEGGEEQWTTPTCRCSCTTCAPHLRRTCNTP